MSIQPNRVLARIVEQVDRSDWPELASSAPATRVPHEVVRVYWTRDLRRHATPIHFWVHALRDELTARGRRVDLVAAAGQALCRSQPLSEWQSELESILPPEVETEAPILPISAAFPVSPRAPHGARAYRMLESACRRSSVLEDGDRRIAHFWGHGVQAPGVAGIWRRRLIR